MYSRSAKGGEKGDPKRKKIAKIVGVFRVKNQDFTPKNHIFSNCGGRRENFWGILDPPLASATQSHSTYTYVDNEHEVAVHSDI